MMLMLETLQKIVTLASCISRFVLAKLDPVIARCAPAWSPPRVARLHDSIATSPRSAKMPLLKTRQNFE